MLTKCIVCGLGLDPSNLDGVCPGHSRRDPTYAELREDLRVAVVGHRCWTLQWAISEHRTSIEDAREAARKLGYDGTCEVREWLESRIELMENVANPLLARMLKETT